MSSAAGRVPVVAVNNVSRHLGSSVGVAIFALLIAGPQNRTHVMSHRRDGCHYGRQSQMRRHRNGANFFLELFATTDGVSARKWFCCEQKGMS
jgi:hypothetical protein